MLQTFLFPFRCLAHVRRLVLRLPSRCVKSFNCLHELRPAGGNPSSESGALSSRKLSSWEKTCKLKPYSVYLQIYLHPLQHIKIKHFRIPLIGTQVTLRKCAGAEKNLLLQTICRKLELRNLGLMIIWIWICRGTNQGSSLLTADA